METVKKNRARLLPDVRSDMKELQLERLKVKAKVAAGEIEPSVYSGMYAQQPDQIAAREIQRTEKDGRRALKLKVVSQARANARGGTSVFKGGA